MPTYIYTAPSGQRVRVSGDAPPSDDQLKTIFEQAGVLSPSVGPPALDERGRPAGSSHLSDAPPSDLMQMLTSAAHPQSVGDFLGLLIPSAGGGLRSVVDTAKMGGQVLRESVGEAPSLSKLPLTILQKLTKRAYPPEVTPGAMSPRLASKAPVLTDVLTEAVNDARKPSPPSSVSLPGGDTFRAEGSVPSGANARVATPVESPSGAPRAAAPPSPAPPAPPPSTGQAKVAGRAAAQTGIRLTSEESAAVKDLVSQGYAESDVVKAIVQQREAAPAATRTRAAPSQPPPSEPAATATSVKPHLNAAESTEYRRLRQRGKSHQEAMTLIEDQRAFQQRKGLPTSEETRRAIGERNDSGRW